MSLSSREKLVFDSDITSLHSALRNKLHETDPYQWPIQTFSALGRLGSSVTEGDKAIAGQLSVLSISSYHHNKIDCSGIITANKKSLNSIYISNASDITNFSIQDFAFANLSQLSYVNLPTAKYIGKRFISNCVAMYSVSLPQVVELADEAFYSYIGQTEGTISLPEVTKIGASCFYFCSSIRTFTAPKVTRIGSWAFYSCSRIRKLELPLLTEIPDYAFAECIQMQTASFPYVSIAGAYAFSYAQAASDHYFPELRCGGKGTFHRNYKLSLANFPKLLGIEDEMFLRCSAIKYLSFPEVSYIGSSAFWYCAGITGVRPEMFPKLEYLGSGAFSMCQNLEYVELSSVSHMGLNPFRSCTALASVKFLMSSCTIDFDEWNLPFAYCTALSAIYVPSSYYMDYVNESCWSAVSLLFVPYEISE